MARLVCSSEEKVRQIGAVKLPLRQCVAEHTLGIWAEDAYAGAIGVLGGLDDNRPSRHPLQKLLHALIDVCPEEVAAMSGASLQKLIDDLASATALGAVVVQMQ